MCMYVMSPQDPRGDAKIIICDMCMFKYDGIIYSASTRYSFRNLTV